MIHGQQHTEAALRSHLERHGIHVELATELHSFERNSDHVIAHIVKTSDDAEIQETVHARYLVGADGARGEKLNLSVIVCLNTEVRRYRP